MEILLLLYTVYNKFKSVYNKCIKNLFGFARRDSMTGMFMYLSLPTADTIVYNARILFVKCSVLRRVIGLSGGLLILMCSFLSFFKQ